MNKFYSFVFRMTEKMAYGDSYLQHIKPTAYKYQKISLQFFFLDFIIATNVLSNYFYIRCAYSVHIL